MVHQRAGVAGIHQLVITEPVVGELLRLLAIEPPPLTAAALARTLPRRGGAPLDGYRAQVGWLVDELRARCGADVVLLQPTPDLSPLRPATVRRAVGTYNSIIIIDNRLIVD
jgi:hypothetical protein